MISSHETAIYAAVKGYGDAWAANDLAAIVNCYHDDVVFHYFGQNPLAGAHRGKAACLAVLKVVRERTDRKLVSIRDVLVGQHFGLIIAIERFWRDGASITVERLLRYSVRDGKLAECWIYDEDQRLVDRYLAQT
jgi:uncharacterized protein